MSLSSTFKEALRVACAWNSGNVILCPSGILSFSLSSRATKFIASFFSIAPLSTATLRSSMPLYLVIASALRFSMAFILPALTASLSLLIVGCVRMAGPNEVTFSSLPFNTSSVNRIGLILAGSIFSDLLPTRRLTSAPGASKRYISPFWVWKASIMPLNTATVWSLISAMNSPLVLSVLGTSVGEPPLPLASGIATSPTRVTLN